MFRLTVCVLAALLAALLSTTPAPAQGIGSNLPTVIVRSQGPSSADLDLFGLNTFDRPVLGARARGMGGACLAMPGDINAGSNNPAALSFLSNIQLSTETRYRYGSASGLSHPAGIETPGGLGDVPVSRFRPGMTSTYTYNDMVLAAPLLLLNRRAGVSLGYRRIIDFRSGEDTRFVVRSPLGQGDADFGQGVEYKGGVDAITPSFAMALNPRISVGASLNFLSGTITETGNQGVSSFGFVVTRGGLFYEQDVFGTALDLGSQFRVTEKLTLAGVIRAGHDLKFKNGSDSYQPLYDFTVQNPTRFIFERTLMDHTLSVPTQYGLGLAYKFMNDRGVLAVDYWKRPWSKARYTRNQFAIDTQFPDSTSQANPVSTLIPLDVADTPKDARMMDTNHFRFGLEYIIKQSRDGSFQLPLRLGFRREPQTFANVDSVRYEAFYRELAEAARSVTGTAAERQARVRQLVDQLYRSGNALLTGDEVPSTVITAGAGIKMGAFSADVSISRTKFTVDRMFLGSFSDVSRSSRLMLARESYSVTEVGISTTLRF